VVRTSRREGPARKAGAKVNFTVVRSQCGDEPFGRTFENLVDELR
jgi:hypothetical protein